MSEKTHGEAEARLSRFREQARREHGPMYGWPGNVTLEYARLAAEADREKAAVFNGFDIRATLRRVLPEGSTIWTVTQHVTRSGRVTVLPMAFMATTDDPATEALDTRPTASSRRASLSIASRHYVLGREFCEKLGYRWDTEHQGWIGNYGEDAAGSIVAALSMAAYDRPDAYSLGRTA